MRLEPPNRRAARTFARKVRKTGTFEWRNYWRTRPLEEHTVLYEAFSGNGMLCNPEAIFRQLHGDPAYARFKHVWVLDDPARHESTVREFAHDPRVRFVEYRSAGYFRALATSKYLVNNATFPPEFSKRDGQVYLNTWHGTPLKRMGYDAPEGGVGARNVLRNLVSADYILSSSDYMTERMYVRAFRLTNIFRGAVITEGFPRVDRQFLHEGQLQELRHRLRRAGVMVDEGANVVLYAPTWRGSSFQAPVNDVAVLGDRVRALRDRLPDGTVVLLKVHQQVFDFALQHPELRDVLVPNAIPTNQLLALTDVLVNDYSSVCFDFLSTGRPILFFTPDQRNYERDRGRYLEDHELPGPVVTTIADLARLIGATGTGDPDDPQLTHRHEYAAAQARFAPHDDGGAAARVVDVVMGGRTAGHRVAPIEQDGRESILIYLGGMKSNGITASVLNLMANIDHGRFDVSALYNYTAEADQRKNEADIDPRVRLFPRLGTMMPSKRHRRDRIRLQTIGMDAPHLDLQSVSSLFHEEWRRCFGEARFDYVIDYSGYAPFWSFLLLQGRAKSHSIWLHSDLRADQMREVDGRRPHETNLRAVFSTYPAHDHLVSVSPALSEMNAANLSDIAPADKFTWASNTLNYQRIQTMAHGVRAEQGPRQAEFSLSVGALPAAVEALAERHGLAAVVTEVDRQQALAKVLPRLEPGTFTFITVGRLSPEKNFGRMIEAFDRVRREHPLTRLVVVGGGPMLGELQAMVSRLGLSEAVILAGQQLNPYAIMAHCQCFVLSSDYEGHPMVFLEARALGLPIVSTDFPSMRSALPEGVGVVVDPNPAALAAGMSQALAGTVQSKPFDVPTYNNDCLDQFYSAIGVSV